MSNELELFDKSTLQKTEKRIKEMQENGEIDFPPNFSPSNAMKAGWLALQETTDKNNNSVLKSCKKSSVMKSLMEMVTEGLNPAKSQGYFIPYGKELHWQRSYFGDMALAKRVDNVSDIESAVIRKGDEINIEMKDGNPVVESHETSWENQSNDIAGAYAVVKFDDNRPDKYEIMTMEAIRQSWKQRRSKGQTPPQEDFAGEMAQRTVTRRALKPIINSSDDANLLSGQQITAEESHESQVKAEKEEEANQEVVDVEVESANNKSPSDDPNMNGRDEDTNDDGSNDGELPLDDGKTDIENQPDF